VHGQILFGNWMVIVRAYFGANQLNGTMPSGICDAPGLLAVFIDCVEVESSYCACFKVNQQIGEFIHI